MAAPRLATCHEPKISCPQRSEVMPSKDNSVYFLSSPVRKRWLYDWIGSLSLNRGEFNPTLSNS